MALTMVVLLNVEISSCPGFIQEHLRVGFVGLLVLPPVGVGGYTQ